jgi:hypothetical protein
MQNVEQNSKEREHVEDLDVDGRSPDAGSREDRNESLTSIQGREFTNQMNDYYFLKDKFIPWNWLRLM